MERPISTEPGVNTALALGISVKSSGLVHHHHICTNYYSIGPLENLNCVLFLPTTFQEMSCCTT